MMRYKYPLSLTTTGEWVRVRTIITDDIRSCTNLKQNAEPETCLSPCSNLSRAPAAAENNLLNTR